MRPATRVLAAAATLSALLLAARARAVEVPSVGGKPLNIDVTNTSILNYHFNNRNDANFVVPTQVDDNYGEWLDRLNLQATWWRLRLGFRLDSAFYFHQPDRDSVAAMVADQKSQFDKQAKLSGESAAQYANDRTTDYYRELHSRYLRAIYPSKLYAGYSQRGVDVTVGDYYVQLGRGLVFSVRKIDELAVDTTVRGVKVVADHDFGPIQLSGVLFAGQMNPLRVDETSGRRLNGTGSPLFFGFPVGGNLETYDLTARPGRVVTVTDLARPSYLEDTAAGGHLELGTKHVQFGGNAALLLRKSYTEDYLHCIDAAKDVTEKGDTRVQGHCAARYPEFSSPDPSRQHNRILNFSGSINVPSILKHGDLYLEVAGQQMRDGHLQPDPKTSVLGPAQDLSGYAIYASASVTGGPVSVSLEGKHYRNFFPLAANIDTTTPAFGAPEYALVTYSQPPTAEPIYTETVSGGSPNVCITGGRANVDYRFNPETSVYAWVGRYTSWSEDPVGLGQGCAIVSQNQTNTWDSAVGADLGLEHGKSHAKAWVGARTTDNVLPHSTQAGPLPIDDFYREGYIRYDIIKHLGGRFSLQFQGVHRHRFEPLSFAKAWTEGENYTALQWSPHLSVIFGYEYMAKDLCQPERSATLSDPARPAKNLCHFFNGGVQWRSGGSGTGAAKAFSQIFDTVNVFVGQRRGAIRCVSGVCRQFPPFEGAKLEITSRF